MTTLHMEVETSRSAQNSLRNTAAQMESLLQSLSSTINELQPAWLGNSATEFFSEYEQWRSAAALLLENLDTLSIRLNNEINEWESASAKLA